jgi:chromosome segregation protein
MRLISLTIKGFKSFANETVIHFNERVIGIVGPNGSGKSNVVDAIRWVLGEQKSKDLRLEQMADVIFNGTKKRKEASTASVELLFDNDKAILPTDYSQISISRTLYRSGESEYRLNGVVCRLKDIKSLLVDTGIGSNSYSIIALGMVDDILEDKDDARRRMFEQAAGISKYKNRKKETLQKLKLTTEDLNRVDDLLFEIDTNVKNLEKQAKRAKKYVQLQDEYKDLSIVHAVKSISIYKDDYKLLENIVAQDQVKYAEAQGNLATLEAEIERDRNDVVMKESALSSKQKELGQVIGNIRSTENEKNLLEQSRVFKNQNIKSAEKSLEDQEVLKIQLLKDIAAQDDRIKIESEISSEKEVVLKNSLTDLNSTRENYNGLKREEDQRINKITDLQNQIFEIEKNIAVKQNQVEQLKIETKNLSSQTDEANNSAKTIEESLQLELANRLVSEKELERLKNLEETKNQVLQSLEFEKEKLRLEELNLTKQRDSKQNEFDLLQSMVQSFEGFPESIKYLATHWRKDVPILSDILDVAEDYRAMIENFLEPYLNFYIADSKFDALEAINILGGAQKGKANFFLIDEISKLNLSTEVAKGYTKAIDLVNVDDRFKALLTYLLRQVYISENVDDNVVNDLSEGAVVLSKNGSLIQTKVSISGGAVGLFEGKKIGRKKNLEKLETAIKSLVVNLTEIDVKQKKNQAEIDQIKKDNYLVLINEANLTISKINQNKARIQANQEGLLKQIEQISTKIGQNKISIREAEDQSKVFNTTLSEKVNELNTLKGKDNKDSSSLDQLADALTKATEVYNLFNIEFIKQQNLLATLSKDLEYKQLRLKECNQKITLDKNKIQNEKEDYHEASEKLVILDRQLKHLYTEKSGFQGTINESETAYHLAKEKIADKEEKIKTINRVSNQLQVTINQNKEKYNELKYEINAVGDRLKIEFNINIEEISNREIDESLDVNELKDQIASLKHKLLSFGEVNTYALQAYEEIKIRYNLIMQQRTDILEAQTSLKETIKEIEDTAVSQFMAAFDQIRQNFISVFRHLFTEDDTCDLILLDENDPLESYIDIVAKPKGKKPKSLSQLSGGEKTLTATALLFALYLLKPAPFCIFDEVDAPLDDANISKFNNIIKNFSERSQFIIVTHNKATMTSVDILYGVYMQEAGVSSVTPVDFRNFEDDKGFLEAMG